MSNKFAKLEIGSSPGNPQKWGETSLPLAKMALFGEFTKLLKLSKRALNAEFLHFLGKNEKYCIFVCLLSERMEHNGSSF